MEDRGLQLALVGTPPRCGVRLHGRARYPASADSAARCPYQKKSRPCVDETGSLSALNDDGLTNSFPFWLMRRCRQKCSSYICRINRTPCDLAGFVDVLGLLEPRRVSRRFVIVQVFHNAVFPHDGTAIDEVCVAGNPN